LKAGKVEIPLKEPITQWIRAENPRTVKDLFEIARLRRPTLSEEDFIHAISDLNEHGALKLEVPPPKVNSYLSYLKIPDENAWSYMVVLATLTTFLAIYVLPST